MIGAASRPGRSLLPLSREHEHELRAAAAQFLRLALRPPTAWTTFPAGGGGLERGRLLARIGLRLSFPSTAFNVNQVPARANRLQGVHVNLIEGKPRL
jgi:hypothetical protein